MKVLVILVLVFVIIIFLELIVGMLEKTKKQNEIISKLRDDNVSLCCDNLRLLIENDSLKARVKKLMLRGDSMEDMRKNILRSGKDFRNMSFCPECGGKGELLETFFAGGDPKAYIFECECYCKWECKIEY